ncbi:thiamine monophosphate synthase [Galbibacter orientalis DSM 19592]|uniref:Thiamine monophosphate synthase n=1 Tax=Galbibacter orientalis DSM 19592 TaxID=926559 RepID=I3C3P5_9FLAO|nr:thiamine phosphate synthase [Galbibacter orientalis]EIJ38238.1 thiamine monophosphate synthase [Galbibacter orientalis DSM 19592]
MLIVITSEIALEQEIESLNRLFAYGLETLHIRKPRLEKVALKNYLELIDVKNHNKIMLHQHHELASEFNVKGIHLTEKHRKMLENDSEYIKNHQKMGRVVSTGFHSISALKKEGANYDYSFLSPVFNSISKENYQGKEFEVTAFPIKVIALGGITSATISEVKKMGYQGVAILGSIWQSKHPVTAYKELQKVYKNVFYDG